MLVIFFLVTEFVEKRQLGVVWVFFFPCDYGVFEFLYFKSQTYDCGHGVFWGVCVFQVCGPVCLLVWIGEERTAEIVSCSAVCTNLQAASACHQEFGVWYYLVVSGVVGCLML